MSTTSSIRKKGKLLYDNYSLVSDKHSVTMYRFLGIFCGFIALFCFAITLLGGPWIISFTGIFFLISVFFFLVSIVFMGDIFRIFENGFKTTHFWKLGIGYKGWELGFKYYPFEKIDKIIVDPLFVNNKELSYLRKKILNYKRKKINARWSKHIIVLKKPLVGKSYCRIP